MANAYLFSKMTHPWVRPLALLVLSGWLLATTVQGQTFTLTTGAANPFNGIDVGTYSRPSLGDVDGDGKLDVVVGESDGTLRYFKNTGTATAPVYAQQTGAANPFNGIDVGGGSAPSLGDVNGDGKLDLVVGQEAEGSFKLIYYKNTGTSTAPVYTQQTGANNPFDGIAAGTTAAPSLGDVHGDGKLDLVLGIYDSDLPYFKNTGTATAPVYTQQTGAANPFNGVDVGTVPVPSVGDVDGDGDLDLVVGEFLGNLYYYKNTGTFTAPVYVKQTGAASPFNGVNFSTFTYVAPSLGDVNGDGKLDVVVGEQDGTLYYFKNTTVTLGITQQPSPASQSVCVGGSASSTVAASGTGTLAYAWYRNQPDTDEPVSSQTSAILSLTGVQLAQAGRYYARVTSGGSSVWSEAFTLTVNALPVVSITGLASSYCKDATAVTLAGSPSGGSFTIDGNAATSFNPASLAPGGHTVVYTYTDGNSCSNTASQTVTVNALPLVSITGLASSFCQNASAVTLAGSPAGGSFTLDGNAATSFNPASLALGDHTVVYTYTDGNSCSNSTSQTVTVNALPVVSITGLASSYCKDASAVTLAGSPAGGSFTVDGNAATNFDPANLALGEHTVLYSYTDGNSCNNTASQTVTVNPLPDVSILGLASSYCQNASAVTLAGSPAGGSFTIDGNAATTFDPASLAVGDHEVFYTFTTGAGCSASATKSVTIIAPFFTQQPSVSTGLVLCANQSVTISFQVNCPANASFTAELSNSTGTFTSGTQSLGPVTPGVPNVVTIPGLTTPTSAAYRIRVVGANPTMYSDPTGMFRINALEFSSNPTVNLTAVCAGANIKVSFTVNGNCPFLPGNVFSVELSDASGSFASPVVLGSAAPGINTLTVPQTIPTGGGYRVRIRATAPAQRSTQSAVFTINQPAFASNPSVSNDNKCAGQAVRLSFSVGCAFFAGNTFTAQLSNAAGSFAAPVNVGTVTPGALNNVTIPAGTPAGTGYKLRIVSSNPEAMSAVSGNFKVKACGNTREVAPEALGLVVVVSPNPSPEGRLRISVSGVEGQALTVELFNGMGQSVREQRIPKAGETEILNWDISRQPAGLYLLRVSGEKESESVKVLH